MAEPALYSIITITLNNLEGLKNTAASILAQTNQDLEWIVIDGGSRDGTQAWLENTKASWVSEKDNGLYDAMNKGIERATGKYLLFLNAGDALAEADTLAHIAEDIYESTKTPEFIYGDALETLDVPEDQNENACVYKPARPYSKRALGMFTHHQAMFYQRERLAHLRYNAAYSIAADYDLTLRFLEGSDRVLYTPRPVCIFEHGGLSQQQAKLGRREQKDIRKALGISNPFKNHLISAFQSISWTLRQVFPNLYWSLRSK